MPLTHWLKNTRVHFTLRLLLGLVLILVVIFKVDIGKTFSLFRSIRSIHVILIAVLAAADIFLTAYRWQMLLRSKKIAVPLGRLIRINFVGRFVGRFFPSSVAPDAIKAYSLSKYIGNAQEAMSSIFIERYIGLFSLLIWAILGGVLSIRTYRNYDILWILSALLLFFAVIWLLLSNRTMAKRIFNIFPFLQGRKWTAKVKNFYGSLYEYRTERILLLKVLLFSFLIQAVRILIIYVASVAIVLGVSVGYFFLFVPIIIMISLVPTTIAGIGVAEGAYVYFFTRVGAAAHGAFALSILVRIIYIFLTLPGGIVYISEGISPSKSKAAG
jgi:uncharacterized protein (TIRG00374 family)